MSAETEKNNFALVPKTPVAIEKAEPGAKRVLSDMVTDALVLAKSGAKASEAAGRPVSVIFSAEHIIPDLKARERFAAIREIVAHLISIGRIEPQDEKVVLDAIFKRENSMSTGIGFGIAIPRGRVDCVKDIILAVGVSSSGVEFHALDDQSVKVIVLSIVPASSLPHEMELMKSDAGLLRFLHNANNFGQVHRSNSAQEICSILKPVLDEALASGIWREFDLKWRLGARTAALIVKLANQFVSHIKISSGNEVANAKSIMGVMMVGDEGAKTGGRIKVSANGIDMVAALDAMQELFTCGARVDHCINPDCPAKPCLVSYSKDDITYGCGSDHVWNVPRKDEP